MPTYDDELYEIVEKAVLDELRLRPVQSMNSIAHAVAREVLRRLSELELELKHVPKQTNDEC